MRHQFCLDAKDRLILALLEEDSRRPNSDIARLTNLSSPTVADRIARLRDAGVITEFSAQIDRSKVGMPTPALITFRSHADLAPEKIATLFQQPVVRTCYRTESSTFVLLVSVADIAGLDDLLQNLNRYGKTETQLILATVFDGRPLFRAQRSAAAANDATQHSRRAG